MTHKSQITSRSAPVGNPWIIQSGVHAASEASLFCFPYAGGGASMYRPWVRCVPPDVRICAVQLPGRETRMGAKPFRRMESLVRAATEAILPCLGSRFAFFGHSLGALVAFEITRLLRTQGYRAPEALIVAACRAPHLPRRRPDTYNLHDDALVQKLREYQGSNSDVLDDAELMRLLLPTVRADFEVAETYVCSAAPILDCPIVALAGAEDTYVSEAEMEGWRTQTSGPFLCQAFPGGHFFPLTSQPLVIRAIVAKLRSFTR